MEARGEQSPYFADHSEESNEPTHPLVAFDSIDLLLDGLAPTPNHQHSQPLIDSQQIHPLLIESKRTILYPHSPPTPTTSPAPTNIRFAPSRTATTNGMAPIVWRERRPFSRKVVVLEDRVVKVPVERVESGFIEVEHITEFHLRPVQEVTYHLEARETVDYRLQYLPVERKIVHMPQKYCSPSSPTHCSPPTYCSPGSPIQGRARQEWRWVSCDGYNQTAHCEELKKLEERMAALRAAEVELQVHRCLNERDTWLVVIQAD